MVVESEILKAQSCALSNNKACLCTLMLHLLRSLQDACTFSQLILPLEQIVYSPSPVSDSDESVACFFDGSEHPRQTAQHENGDGHERQLTRVSVLHIRRRLCELK